MMGPYEAQAHVLNNLLGHGVLTALEQHRIVQSQMQAYNQIQNVPLGGAAYFASDALLNAYRPPEKPKIAGETFAQWQIRFAERVRDLDDTGQTWPWVEGQNWKAEIDAWAKLYGVEE